MGNNHIPTSSNPARVFDWLLSLNPTGLHATITIEAERQDFTSENWENIANFAKKFSPTNRANVLLSSTADTQVKYLVGASYYPNSWEPLPANFILTLLQTQPGTLAKHQANPDIVPDDIKSLYPDCPIPDHLPEDEVTNPRITPPQNPPPARNLLQTTPSPNQPQEVLAMLNWIHQLDPEHLQVKISLDQAHATFDKSNWHELPHFSQANKSSPSGTVIFYLTSNQPLITSIAGLSYQDNQWEAYGISFLKKLPELQPSLYSDFSSRPNTIYCSLKDLFPTCPINTTAHPVEW
jgi:hypothetical protein